MKVFNREGHPHRRYNPLLDEWVLVSPHRAKRPWQGQQEKPNVAALPSYDENCYLCPGNPRSNGIQNPNYENCYVFDNDFPALMSEATSDNQPGKSLFFQSLPERGINRVVCFSPEHNKTIPEMQLDEILNVVQTWQQQYTELGAIDYINYVQIFENKGSVMGCSNPHPHGQIWAQSSLPTQIKKTQDNLLKYYKDAGRSLLSDYLKDELLAKERIVFENKHFVILIPFWAVWPFETLIVSKRHFENIAEMNQDELQSFAEILKTTTVKYDNIFETSFPYSAGIYQSPTDGLPHHEWHFHMHFYPPLLRSASVKKFMVGYEMLGEPQRDITAEKSAVLLRNISDIHYKLKNN
ncbi:MAG: UDP-glucose--hexose-1-phosphate uridylyltransferase [Bacteroidetes bacterium]|nr:UDP-glucose--hexose-1-phosphate uridylyltransferase [Bacteroidota bacterium]